MGRREGYGRVPAGPSAACGTVELRVAVVELKHTVATLRAEVARGADAAEEADRARRPPREGGSRCRWIGLPCDHVKASPCGDECLRDNLLAP